MNCEDIETLISGYLDGELTQQESQRVRLHVEDCERCNKVYKQLLSVKNQMKTLSYPKSDEQLLEELEKDMTSSLAEKAAWSLLVVAGVIAILFLGYSFIFDPAISVWIKILYGLFALGGISLFISVLRQRLISYKTDKYKKVKL